MQKLTVLYDDNCGLCDRCQRWLAAQPSYVTIETLAMQSPQAARRYAGVFDPNRADEMIVISDEAGVYRGASAYLICLWALKAHRQWSYRLADPALRPVARRVFLTVAHHRRTISSWLRLLPDEHFAHRLSDKSQLTCARECKS